MLARIDLRGDALTAAHLRRSLPRATTDIDSVLDTVRPIVTAVRDGGGAAALDFGARFDGVRPTQVRVPAAQLQAALDGLDGDIRAALEETIARVRAVHQAQLPREHTVTLAPGGTVAQRWIPVSRVGLYVPGGAAVYPSTVVMNVIPAQVAGVQSLVVASPPQAEFGGLPHPTILAACALLGVTEVWAVGGAQAVALLTYGDDDLEPVDLITGPGNIYVTAAKRLCRSVVGIDAEAGPTEILVLADAAADPDIVASDLISQAEHDPLAASVLVTDSAALIAAVEAQLEVRVAATKHSDRVRTALTGAQSGAILVDSVDAAITVADAYGAEHLEIQTRNSAADAARIRNAGAIFVGAFSPVSLGDYCAGSNHVLPTSGSCRHSSGLHVGVFLRAVNVIDYDEVALKEVAGHVVSLANAEDLPAHGEAVTARFSRTGGVLGSPAPEPGGVLDSPAPGQGGVLGSPASSDGGVLGSPASSSAVPGQ